LLETTISMRVRPNSARNEVVDVTDGVYLVKISAPPVKGKANKELIAFLSRLLGVSKSRVNILKGYTSRNKVIALDGISEEDVKKRLLLD